MEIVATASVVDWKALCVGKFWNTLLQMVNSKLHSSFRIYLEFFLEFAICHSHAKFSSFLLRIEKIWLANVRDNHRNVRKF
jgi:hypothetical protein